MNIFNEGFVYNLHDALKTKPYCTAESYNELMRLAGEECRWETAPLQDDEDQTLVSVIIPTHNRPDMLVRAVDSVLAQTHKATEIIIVDDASTDDTMERIPKRYAGEPRVTYLRNEKSLGPGLTRRRGYLNSKGDFVIYIDDDDYYIEPRFFEKALAVHRENPSLALVAANTITYNNERGICVYKLLNASGFLKKEDYLLGFISKYDKPSSSFPAMFRRTMLEAAGFKDMLMMNDSSIYLRALCFGDAYLLDMIVGIYVLHGSNISTALPHKFLMENLEEKKNIYHLAKAQYTCDVSKWYREQIYSSVRYYFAGTKCTAEQRREVLAWCDENCGNVRLLLLRSGIRMVLRKVNPLHLARKMYWHLRHRVKEQRKKQGGNS